MKTVVVIGAGPSGIMASLKIKEYLKNRVNVILLEKNNKIGKKIIVSGNGKCNITNMKLDDKYVYNNKFAEKLFTLYSPDDLRNDLFSFGLFTKSDSVNRVYPQTESSNTVVDILFRKLNNLGVIIKTCTNVIKINKVEDKYIINATYADEKISFEADIVIVATGGKSMPIHGSNGDGYKILNDFKVNINEVKPGLVGLKLDKNNIKGLNGLRQKASVTLIDNHTKVFFEEGEIQFKEDGISGIVVMNASSVIARSNKKLKLIIDFLPSFDDDVLLNDLINISKNNKDILQENLTFGLLPKQLANLLCGILKKDNKFTINNFINFAKNYEVNIIGNYGFNQSQVSVGGIDIKEIDDNFELKKVPNVYVIGELLDIDGICGGYNMHLAFSSGALVAKQIYQKER